MGRKWPEHGLAKKVRILESEFPYSAVGAMKAERRIGIGSTLDPKATSPTLSVQLAWIPDERNLRKFYQTSISEGSRTIQ